jgi:DNA-binding NarL/FixJ family response regulator
VTKLTIPGAAAEWTLVGTAPARPDIVLAAPGFSVRSLALPRSVRVLKTSDAADAFDLSAAEATNVRVAVLDVDRLGLNYWHDLHTIFPTVRIVAIANDPAVRRRALVAGAAVALPHAAGPARVAAAVRRLAGH